MTQKQWAARRWSLALAVDVALVAVGLVEVVAWRAWWAAAPMVVAGGLAAVVAARAIRLTRWLEAHRGDGGAS